MFTVFLVGFPIILIIAIFTKLVYFRVNYQWLNNLAKYIVWSLPFEFFPRIEIAGSGFRISQFLVLISIWVIVILLIKKNTKLLNHKLSKWSFFPVIFGLLSFPSWFLVQDWLRFSVFWFGTILVFGAMLIVGNFVVDIEKRLKELAWILVGCGIFGLYQFVGDMIGLPTGLREHYTKAVFGIPRVQGTAVEPLYFAGMLIIAIFVFLVMIMSGNSGNSSISDSSNSPQSQSKTFFGSAFFGDFFLPLSKFARFRYKNWIGLSVILLAFVLTLSKGSFAVLALLIPFVLVLGYFKFQFWQSIVNQYLVRLVLIIVLLIPIIATFVDPVILFGSVGQNFVETLAGTSPSAVERGRFGQEAILALSNNLVQGVGMGQYAQYVGDNLGNLNLDRKAIVNNVYLEVWLENGFLALMSFVVLLVGVWLDLLRNVLVRNQTYGFEFNSQFNSQFCLLFILSAYYLQWTLFSPIFIMPIFVLLGLGIRSCELAKD